MNQLLAVGAASAAAIAGAPANAAAPNGEPAPSVPALEHSIQSHTGFEATVLKPHEAVGIIEVTGTGSVKGSMDNPVVIRSGKRIVSYAARKGEQGITEIPANQAKIVEYTTSGVHTIKDPRKAGLVVTRKLKPADYTGGSPGFTSGGNLYGFKP